MNSAEHTQREAPSQSNVTVAACRRTITIVRYMVGVATAAVLISNWISVTSSDPDGGSNGPGTPGKIQIARYLDAIALPLVLIAAVLALSVMAAIYVERLHTDSVRRTTRTEQGQSPMPSASAGTFAGEPDVAVRQSDGPDDSAWRRS